MTKIIVVLLAAVALIVTGTFLITLVWQWVVPDIFAGMVKAELLPASITMWQALKLSIPLFVLGGASSRSSRK